MTVNQEKNGFGLDISSMSLDEIKSFENSIQKAKTLKIKQDLLDMKEQFLAYCKDNDINVIDAVKIMGFATQGYFRKTKPKYQDPITGVYWAGRGRVPKWYKERITQGYTDNDLLTDADAMDEDE